MSREYRRSAIDPNELRELAQCFTVSQLAAQFDVGCTCIRRELAAHHLSAKAAKPQTQPRTCLKCGATFGSSWSLNRRCTPCKRQLDRQGASLG